jgi:glycosidase
MIRSSLLSALMVCVGLTWSDSSGAPSPLPSPPPETAGADVQYGTPFPEVPNPKDAVLYQVNIRAFSPAGTFSGVEARLDSIKALGVNVLYLLPIYPVGVLKSVNSPYCVRNNTEVNSEFGTMADLRKLAEEAHKRKIAVLLDWVADHTSWDNPWISNKSWYRQDTAGNIISPPSTNWTDVAKLNFGNPDMRKAMIDAMKYWVYQANIDGFRCDAADFIPSDFWLQAITNLRAIRTHRLLMYAEGTRQDLFTAGFQLKYGMAFYDNLVHNIYEKKGSVRSIDPLNLIEDANATCDDRVVRYTCNHDVILDGTPLDLLGGRQGSLAAFVVASYMDGVPMIYDGQEVGCPLKLNFMDKKTPIDWSINPDLTEEYKRIIGFRNNSEALRQGTLESFSSDDVCAFTRTFKTEQVLVVDNLRNSAVSYRTPPKLVGSDWQTAFTGDVFQVTGQITLQPFQYIILTRQNKEILTQALYHSVVNGATPPPADAGPVQAHLSVVGDWEGWNPSTAPLINEVKGSPGKFEGYIDIPGDGPHFFKLTSAPDWKHATYGDGGNGKLSTDGKGAISVSSGGYYELTADLNSDQWTATKTSWSIIGNATSGGWTKDTPMKYDPTKGVWSVSAPMVTGGSFKFRANGAWSIDFGIDEEGNLQYVDNPFFTYNPSLRNLSVPGDGSYTITLDLHTPGKYTYSVTGN